MEQLNWNPGHVFSRDFAAYDPENKSNESYYIGEDYLNGGFGAMVPGIRGRIGTYATMELAKAACEAHYLQHGWDTSWIGQK